jgi:hypothetical protein
VVAGYRQLSKLLVAGYFAARLAGLIPVFLAAGAGYSSSPLFYAVYLAGTVLLFWGCWALARSKGYSGWFALVGLAGILGLVALALFPDRAAEGGGAGVAAGAEAPAAGTGGAD